MQAHDLSKMQVEIGQDDLERGDLLTTVGTWRERVDDGDDMDLPPSKSSGWEHASESAAVGEWRCQ